jgi:hypothetical protein
MSRRPRAPQGLTLRPIVMLALGCFLATSAGFAIGIPWVLPLFGALAAYPFWASALVAGQPRRAVSLMLIWALFLSIATAVATAAAPGRAAQVIWMGPAYAQEMLHWVRTGVGPEGTPSLYLPQHALHFLAFNAACLLTAGLAGLFMGAALLNYMNYYVVVLAAEASGTLGAVALGWPPWAIIRVAGFILAAAPLSAVLLCRLLGCRTQNKYRYWKYYQWGLILVVTDAVLKAILAPFWRLLLLKNM